MFKSLTMGSPRQSLRNARINAICMQRCGANRSSWWTSHSRTRRRYDATCLSSMDS
jgi:hypothetical protein